MHDAKKIRRLLISFGLFWFMMAYTGHFSQAQGSSLSFSIRRQALLISLNPSETNSTVERLKALSVQITHQFPPDAFIITYPKSVDPAIFLPTSAQLFNENVDLNSAKSWSPSAYQAALTWNEFQDAAAMNSSRQPDESQLHYDQIHTFEAPLSTMTRTTDDDPRPNALETSQFFIGSVAVGLILPESDGSIDPSTEDWTAEKRALVVSEIAQGLDWWATKDPRAQLSFVYDNPTGTTLPTSVEPISHPRGDQGYWIEDTMNALGFVSSNYFDQVRLFNQSLREKYQTDWAFTIFVVDSQLDADDMFSDYYFAYAYLGGPFMVMTYENQNYGPWNMDAVTAHEAGHIFRALDQYSFANTGCDLRAGYLKVENQNFESSDCASNQPSIMRGRISPYTNHELDYFGAGQVGWLDLNQNNIFDPVDVSLSITDTIYVEAGQPNVLTFNSRLEEIPYPAPQSRQILINKLQAAWYRVDDGPWLAVDPVDGQFDAYREAITFTTDPLSTGTHTLYVKTLDNFGKMNEQEFATIATTDPAENQIETTYDQPQAEAQLTRGDLLAFHGLAKQLGGEKIVKVEYRIDGQSWQPTQAEDGQFDGSAEYFTFSIDTANFEPGTYLIQARAADSLGQVESSPASQIIIVKKQPMLYLPLVVGAP